MAEFDIKVRLQAEFSNMLKSLQDIQSSTAATTAALGGLSGELKEMTPGQLRAARAVEQLSKATLNYAKSQAISSGNISQAVREIERLDKATQGATKSAQEHNSEIGGRNYRNASTSIDDYIALETEARKKLSDQIRAEVQERDKLGTLAGGRNFSNISTEVDAEIQKRQELSRQLKVEIEERDKLATIQGGSGYSNISTEVDAEIQKRQGLSSQLRTEIQERDRLAAIKGGRDYNNISVQVDAEIDSRKEVNRQLGESIQARYAESEANDDMMRSLPRLRYALYDVSNTFAIAGAALLAMGVGAMKTSIDMERAFANTARTVGGDVKQLRDDFLGLFKSMPVSWDALTEIGTLAGQLNIASQDVTEFTRLVAMFSATTDVSVEQSAVAFGRLSQLLEVSSEDYEKLGSSILRVGVNSIATESEIISISTQIAGIARQANLSADEVFGLAASFASLGVQPELTRGTVTRLFGQIERAIAGGGVSLERFASLSGMTAQEFSSAWGSDSSGVLLSFIQGLQNVEDAGGSATAALRDLGITSVRDIPALLRLAQSADMVAENFKLAADGFAEGTDLAEHYGKIADTMAARLQKLGNNFTALMDTIGGVGASAGAKGFVDFLSGMVQFINDIMSMPLAGTIAAWGIGLTTLAGVVSLAVAGFARFVASAAAMRGVMYDVTSGTGQLGVAKANVTRILTGETVALEANTVAHVQNNAAVSQGVAATNTSAASTTRAAAATSVWTSRLKMLGWAALGVGTSLVAMDVFKSASRSITQAIDEWTGLTRQAEQYNLEIEKTGELSDDTFKIIEGHLHRLQALGTNDANFLTQMGDFFSFGLGGQGNQRQGSSDELDKYIEAIMKLASDGNIEAAKTLTEGLAQAMTDAGWSAEDAEKRLYLLNDAIGNAEKAALIGGSAMEEFADTIKDSLTEILDPISNMYSLGNAIEDIATIAIQGGIDSSQGFAAIRTGIDAVIAAHPENAANNLQAFYNFLIEGAGVSANSLIALADLINSLGGATGAATIDFSNFVSAVNNAARSLGGGSKGLGGAAKKAAKEIRTLLDYAKDLQGVISRAFDFRFATDTTADTIRATWRKINEEIEEARRNINELTADRNIKVYWLSVAEAFGDTLRADKLRVEIEGIDASISKEQEVFNKELEGTTANAEKNRDRMQDLVKKYQDHLVTLAENGASQETLRRETERLRQEFMREATQLGFNQTELKKYSVAFDDVRVAISKVPRNVTVKFDPKMGPAEKAIAEFNAKMRRDATSAGSAAGKNYGTAFNTAMKNQRAPELRVLPGAVGAGAMAGILNSVLAGKGGGGSSIPFRWYKQGGYTGNYGVNQAAGIVHGREYVVPAHGVDQRTRLPKPEYMAQLTSGVKPRGANSSGGYRNGGFVQGSGGGLYAMIDPGQMRQLIDGLAQQIAVIAPPDVIYELSSQGAKQASRQGRVS